MRKLALVLLCSLLACPVLAQFPGSPRGGMRADRGAPRPVERAPAGSAATVATTSGQLDLIEDELKLTEAQRPLWLAYADRVQKLADDTARARSDARIKPVEGSAPDQLERLAADEQRRAAAIEQITKEGKALYAALTPEQRTVADRRLAAVLLPLTTGVATLFRSAPPPRSSR